MSESEGTEQDKIGKMTTTGEIVRTAASNTNTEPLLKTEEDYLEYNAAIRVIRNLQVEDPMEYQQQHGYYPTEGDTDIEKRGLTPEDQRRVMAGEARLEEIDKEKHIYRAEAISSSST
jgi:hypothetical protein